MVEDDLGAWESLAVRDLAPLLGGWAIDLFVGHQTRQHDDLDVLVLRRDQLAVQQALHDWDLHAADPPGTLRPWLPGETLGADIHDVWCRACPAAPWAFQLMLADLDATGTCRVFRRDQRITGLLSRLGRRSPAGIPFAPEVQLLYKAKPVPRAKDEHDFAAALPLLDAPSRRWLTQALSVTQPQHPWRAHLVPE